MLLLYKCSNTHFTQKKGQNNIWQLFLGGETYKELFLSNFYISPLLEFFTYVSQFCNQKKKKKTSLLKINHSSSFLAMTQFTRTHLLTAFQEPIYKLILCMYI